MKTKIKSLKTVALVAVITLLISALVSSGCASKGEIIIKKVTNPSSNLTETDGEFRFILTGGPSELNQSFNLTDGQTYTSGTISSGDSYNASEIVPFGWGLSSATCDDGSPVDNIDVASGETVTCTFENTKKVEIVLYTDFECAGCWRLNAEVEGELQRRYVDTGKVDLDVRLLGALGLDSSKAAQAALCAADQRRFWEYRFAIFASWYQDGLSSYSEEALLRSAMEIGLNEEAFSSCLQSGTKVAEVEDNRILAEAAGVTHVPTMFINDVKMVGFKPLATYVKTIEELIAR